MPAEVTRVGPKFQVTIPKEVREALGLKVGDFVQASVAPHNSIILRRKLLVDFDADLEEDLAAAEADYKAGRVLGPFDTAEETVAALGRGAGRQKRAARKGPRKKAQRRISKAAATLNAVKHARAAHR
jgi:AbrB family looped-hinge helix DNA binding protein